MVGSANNQLASPADAERLRHRSVIYAPDFVANAGGVINIAEEPHGYDRARAYDRIRTIHDTLLQGLVPDAMRGRVMSVYTLIAGGLMPLGSMLLGSLGEAIGVPLAVGLGGIVTIAVAVAFVRWLEEVRGVS